MTKLRFSQRKPIVSHRVSNRIGLEIRNNKTATDTPWKVSSAAQRYGYYNISTAFMKGESP